MKNSSFLKKITLLSVFFLSIYGYSQNITIESGSTSSNIDLTNGNFTATGASAVLGVEHIIAALANGPVTIATEKHSSEKDGNIFISEGLIFDQTKTNTLTINASNNIFINGSISTIEDSGNFLKLKLTAGKTVLINDNIDLGNGELTVTGIKSVKNTAKLIAKNISFYSGDVNDSEILHSGKIEGQSIHIKSNNSGTVHISGTTELITDNATMTVAGGRVELDGAIIDSDEYTGGFFGVYADEVSIDADINLLGGFVLIDPDDVTVDAAFATTIETALDGGADFSVEADNSITVSNQIDTTSGSDNGNSLIFREQDFGEDGSLVINLDASIILNAGQSLVGGSGGNVGGTTVNVSDGGLISNAADLVEVQGAISLSTRTGSDTVAVDGLGGAGTLVGNGSTTLDGTDGADETFALSTTDGSGTVNGIAFSGVTTIDAGTSTDDTVTTDASTTLTSNSEELLTRGITVSDVENLTSNGALIGSSSADTFELNGNTSGAANGIAFSAVENLDGGEGSDTFVIGDSGSLSGTIDGGVDAGGDDTDTLDYSAETGAVAVNLSAGSATSIASFSNIEDLVGNGGSTTLTGTASADTFSITASNTGTVASVGLPATFSFSDVANLDGGEGSDTFVIGDSGSLSGTIDGGVDAGGDDTDTLDYSAKTGAVAVNLSAGSATSIASFSNIEDLVGNGGSTTLTGTASADTFSITASNTGTVASVGLPATFSFSDVANLAGGGDADMLDFNTVSTYNGDFIFDGDDGASVNFTSAFTINGDLTLANIDSCINSAALSVTGGHNFSVSTINGGAINLGTSADFDAGSVTFNSTGAVTINETFDYAEPSDTGDMDIVGANTAASVNLDSTGAISDAGATSLTVTGLTDVNGTSISLGGGTFDTGTLTFNSTDAVTVSEDSAMNVAGANAAEGTITLETSTGSITIDGVITASDEDLDLNSAIGMASINNTVDLGTGSMLIDGTLEIATAVIVTGNVTGGANVDTLIMRDGAQLVGQYDGNAGDDTLEVAADDADVTPTGLGATDGFNGEVTDSVISISGDDFANVNVLNHTGGGTSQLTGMDQNAYWNLNNGQYSASIGAIAIGEVLTNPAAPTGEVLTFSGFDVLQGSDQQDWFDISGANATAQLKGGAGDDVFFFSGSAVLTSSVFDDSAIYGGDGFDVLAGNLSQYDTAFGSPNRSERITDPISAGVDEFIEIGVFKKNGDTTCGDFSTLIQDIGIVAAVSDLVSLGSSVCDIYACAAPGPEQQDVLVAIFTAIELNQAILDLQNCGLSPCDIFPALSLNIGPSAAASQLMQSYPPCEIYACAAPGPEQQDVLVGIFNDFSPSYVLSNLQSCTSACDIFPALSQSIGVFEAASELVQFYPPCEIYNCAAPEDQQDVLVGIIGGGPPVNTVPQLSSCVSACELYSALESSLGPQEAASQLVQSYPPCEIYACATPGPEQKDVIAGILNADPSALGNLAICAEACELYSVLAFSNGPELAAWDLAGFNQFSPCDIYACAAPGDQIQVITGLINAQVSPEELIDLCGIACEDVNFANPSFSCNEPPIVACQNINVFTNGSCEGTATAADFDAGSIDPDGDPITFSISPAGPFGIGTTQVTLTVSDGEYSESCTATITVEDNEAPEITCATDISVSTNTGACEAFVTVPTPISSDNCTVTGNGDLKFDGTNDYVTIGDINALDGINQLSVETWVKFDVLSPNQRLVTKELTNNSTNGWSLELKSSGTGVIVGMRNGSNTYGYTDNGVIQVGSWVHVAFVFDGTQALNSDRLKIYINGVQEAITINGTLPSSTGINNNHIILGNLLPNWYPLDGNIDEVRIWNSARTGAEILGNRDVELMGNESGLLMYYDFNQGTSCSNNSGITTLIDRTSNGYDGYLQNFDLTGGLTDPCDSNWDDNRGPFITNDYTGLVNANAIYPIGTTTITWSATDAAGNTATCEQDITVTDNEDPVISCPSDINEIATSASGTVVNYTAPTGTDNCSATTALITTLYPSGATFPIGTTTVTYEVTDSAGLTANCSFTVTVTGVLPEIVCPANITVNNDAGACGAVVSFDATDTVGIPESTITYSHVSGSEFPVGTTTVTATATNAVGSDSCTFTVTVNDTEDPVISCLPDITVNNTAGQCSADLALLPPTVSDNCGTFDNALDFDGGNDYVLITNPVSSVFSIEAWVKTSANSPSGTFAFQGDGIVWSDVGGGANDFTVSILNNQLSFFDGAGNIGINGTTILNDNVWHHIAVIRNGSVGTTTLYVDGVLDGSGSCNNVVLNANPNIAIGANTLDSRYFDGQIDQVRIWNTARTQTEIQANINNELDTEPGLVASYNFNQGIANGNNTGVITAIDTSGNGNNGTLNNFALSGLNSNWVGGISVGGLTLTNNGPAAYPIGTTTVTWTATDAAGNTATCDQVVTVIDNEVPIAICNEITVQLDETGNYTLTQVDINALGAGSISACGDGDVTFSVDLTSFSCDDIGSVGNSTEIDPTFVSQVAQNSHSIGAAYNPITEEFLFPNWANSTISRYDINRNLLGTYTHPHQYILDLWVDGSDTGDLFSSDWSNQRIYRVDASNNVVWNVPSSNGRVQAITTDAQYVYTHVPGQNYLRVYDKTTGAFVNNLTLGFNPGTIRSLIYANGKIYMGGIATSGSTLNGTWSTIHIINAADGAYISSFSTSIPSFYGLAFDGEVIWVHNGSQAAGYQIAEGSAYNTGNVVLTVTDSNGQTSTCNANVIVLDTVVPTISCPGDIDVDNDAGLCGAVVTYDVLSDDNCSASLIVEQTDGLPSGSLFEVGTTTNTFVVTDASGNTETCSFDVTVADTEAPVVACNEITIVLDGNGDVNLSASQLNMSSTDNCGGPLTFTIDGESSADFSCSDTGGDLDQLIISEYIDGAGANDCIEIYNGTGNPVVLTGNYSIAVYTDSSTTPTVWPLLGTIAADNAYVVCQQFSSASGVDLTNGLTLTGNDAVALQDNGNAVDIIGIIGNDPGTGWSAGTNQTNDRTLRRNDDVFAGDISNSNAGLASEWTSFPSTDMSGLGTHDIETVGLSNNVILTVTDIYGNSSTCEAAVTVVDDTLPIAIAQDVVVQLDASGNGSTSGVLVNNGSSDVCGIASLVLNQNDFTCADVGNANPVILTVTDVNGNIATAPANVTVIDGVAPNAITQDAVVVLDANGNGSITVADINNGSNDACGVDTVTISPSTFNCSNVGNNEVTLTVTDVNNNVSTATANVEVQDNTNPTAVCQAVTVTLDANGSATITAADVDGGSEDACGIFSYEIDIDTFGCDDLGDDNTVTLTVTDNNGNSSSCTAVVTVLGDLPVVDITEAVLPGLCQGDFVLLTANSDLGVAWEWFLDGVATGDTAETIEASEDGVYTVDVTSATNCTTAASYTVTGFDLGALISAYTIVAQDWVYLHGDNIVQSGGVGAMNPGTGNIKLHQTSNIVGFAQAPTFNIQAGSTIGTQVTAPANPIIPAFESNTVSNAGSPNVTVNNNATQNLNGSVYGTVTIRQGATVTFTQANVYIDEIKTFKNATIEFAGCTNVYINEKFQLAEDGVINANGNYVTMYVDDDVMIERGSDVRARIHANDNQIHAKGFSGNNNNAVTYMTGLFIADTVHGSNDVVWNQDPLCDPCPVDQPLTNPTDDTENTENSASREAFDVKAWPNPSNTTFNVQLVSQNIEDNATIYVFDMNNKLVHTTEFGAEDKYNFGSNLEGGVYIVKVVQGKNMKHVRLVKY